jgi:hypothetical protein
MVGLFIASFEIPDCLDRFGPEADKKITVK